MKNKFLISFYASYKQSKKVFIFIHFIAMYSFYTSLQSFCYSLQSGNSRIRLHQQWITFEQTGLPHCLQFIKKRIDSFQIAFLSFNQNQVRVPASSSLKRIGPRLQASSFTVQLSQYPTTDKDGTLFKSIFHFDIPNPPTLHLEGGGTIHSFLDFNYVERQKMHRKRNSFSLFLFQILQSRQCYPTIDLYHTATSRPKTCIISVIQRSERGLGLVAKEMRASSRKND